MPFLDIIRLAYLAPPEIRDWVILPIPRLQVLVRVSLVCKVHLGTRAWVTLLTPQPQALAVILDVMLQRSALLAQ